MKCGGDVVYRDTTIEKLCTLKEGITPLISIVVIQLETPERVGIHIIAYFKYKIKIYIIVLDGLEIYFT